MRPFTAFNLFTIFTVGYLRSEAAIVQISQGKLEGTTDKSRAGIPYFSFRGIPYAKPPIGNLRFEDPQDPEPWEGVRRAVEYASPCIQIPSYGPVTVNNLQDETPIGNEDCLHLNVFTPTITSNLPVLVWIHGGGFTVGGAHIYRPDYFMDQPIVLVTINYRLGSLGFPYFNFSGMDPISMKYVNEYGDRTEFYVTDSSNISIELLGFKDQTAALRWVKNNIRAFGGDPTRVTIAGQSAGGLCIYSHLFYPPSRGLFHRVISQSLLPFYDTRMDNDGRENLAKTTLFIVYSVGCANPHVTFDLRSVMSCLKKLPIREIHAATQVVRRQIGPREKEFKALLFGMHFFWRSDFLMTLISDIPWLLGFTYNDQRTPDNLAKDVSVHRGLKYVYVLDHLPRQAFAYDQQKVNEERDDKFLKETKPIHNDDLILLFNTTWRPEQLEATDKKVSRLMIRLWTNFATTGNPNDDDLKFQWPPLVESNIKYLRISPRPKIRFWKHHLSEKLAKSLY